MGEAVAQLWQVAWITLPWANALETAFMSNEALFAWREKYTALRWLAATAAGLMGVVHGRLLSIPWKTRLATGTAVTCEMWAIFYVRGVATVVGVPVCTAFSLCLAICLFIYRNQQSLAQVSAGALITHGYNYESVDGSAEPESAFTSESAATSVPAATPSADAPPYSSPPALARRGCRRPRAPCGLPPPAAPRAARPSIASQTPVLATRPRRTRWRRSGRPAPTGSSPGGGGTSPSVSGLSRGCCGSG